MDSGRWRGPADPGGLEVDQRTVPGLLGEAAQQRAGADLEGVREGGEVVPLGEVLVEVPHDPL
ncbi:hypothetical protein ABZ743_22395 [Streptomyces sp. NPDC006662]|uniref:hypothetical protein n=1 Tax=Streptomyces sp. NPDC006662 TaxID=3156902 RepID=UPI0033FFB536